MKFEVTIVLTYEADPEDYGNELSTAEMLDADVADADSNLPAFVSSAFPYQQKISGKIIEE